MTAATAESTSMRAAYAEWLEAELASDGDVVCLDSDTGTFKSEGVLSSPRYLNVGIAEQNLLAMAAGLAHRGLRPYVNTMATFASMRAVEMVKVDIAYPGLGVRIVATHAGFSAGHLGPTHHALEDIAVMRLLPNLTVVVPADAQAAVALLSALRSDPGPAYVRLDRKPCPALESSEPVRLGRARTLREGDDLTLVGCGAVPLKLALLVAVELERRWGVTVGVHDMHTIVPLDTAFLDRVAPRGPLVTVEDHHVAGGLGGAVAEYVAEHHGGRVLRLGAAGGYQGGCYEHEELLALAGLSLRTVLEAGQHALRLRDRGASALEVHHDLTDLQAAP
jgi:transketolase